MLVHTKTEDKVINFREKAPAAATPDMYVDRPDLAQRVSHVVNLDLRILDVGYCYVNSTDDIAHKISSWE